MSTPYQPIGNTIIVEEIPVSKTITVPSGFVFGTSKCTVVALGDGDKVPASIHVGDTVIVSDNGLSLVLEGKQRLVDAESISAKVVES